MRTRLLLLTALLVCLAGATALQAAGLVKNAEFVTRAEGNLNWPADWSADPAVMRLYTNVNDDGAADKDSLHYRAAAGVEGGAVTQTVTLAKDTDYVLSAAFKSDGKIKPMVRLSGPGGPLATVTSDGSTTWKTLTSRFNSGAGGQAEVAIFGDAAPVGGLPALGGSSAIDAVQVYLPGELSGDAPAAAAFVPPGPNLALGKSYTLSPGPSYSLCTDPGDSTQLTDGVYTVGYFWTQPTTVGWGGANPAIITIDLGQVSPIAGLSYNTAAGVAGVGWPTSILVLTSDDGKAWGQAGDLVNLSNKTGVPPASPYQVRRFATDEIKAHGRFVKLFIEQTPYCFVDEVEVYRGPEALLQAPLGKIVDDPLKHFQDRMLYNGVLTRLRSDLATVREAIVRSGLPATEKAALLRRADLLSPQVEKLPSEIPADFKTILPYNEVHARIFALNAALLRGRGLAPLTAWAGSRWDMLSPIDAPEKPGPAPRIDVQMMCKEYRGAAFNLSNATDSPVSVRISITGLPGGANPDYISVRDVPFTDTRERVPVADALPEAARTATGYRVTIPAGMTRQIWLDFRPLTIEPGTYTGQVTVRSAGAGSIPVLPLSFRLYPLTFPPLPSIHIGGWDYLEGHGAYDADPGNIADFLKILPANYVDTPYAGGGAGPGGGKFDPEGKLTTEFDFSVWDEWTAKWPGARQYAVFVNVPDNIAGEKIGTPRFAKMVGEWINSWVAHMQKQGLRPEQLVLHIIDEPNEGRPAEETDVIKSWARALRAAQPKVRLFEDPTYAQPQDVKDGFWEDVDILCPNLPMFIGADDAFRNFYLAQQAAGRELWFYSCSGPARLLDPIAYHRGQFWYAARYGARGSFYWAFGDEAGGDSWNAYLQKRTAFSPLFVSADKVTDSKHMAAIREGAEDFEYFAMLRSRVAELEQKGVRSPLVTEAKKLSVEGPQSVCAQIKADNLEWRAPKNREMMDEVRVQVLEMLTKLAKL